MTTEKIKKSKRFRKILGDFGESFIIYWLAKRNYEPVLIDYTGIDILAYSKIKNERMGISVKSRTRKKGTGHTKITVPGKDVKKIDVACRYFNALPYFGCVIDQDFPKNIKIFIVPMQDLLRINNFERGEKYLYIRFQNNYIEEYKILETVFIIEMDYQELRSGL